MYSGEIQATKETTHDQVTFLYFIFFILPYKYLFCILYCPPSVFEFWTQPICQKQFQECVLIFLFCLSLKYFAKKPGVLYPPMVFEAFFLPRHRREAQVTLRSVTLPSCGQLFYFVVVIPFGFIRDLLCAKKKNCTMYTFLFIYSDALQSLIISRLFIS